MIRFFFSNNRSVGRVRASSFKSTISAEQHQERSREVEVPVPMVAFSVAMVRDSCIDLQQYILNTRHQLRSELLLWKSGDRESVQFDADAHSNAFDHHVDALQELRTNFPVKFHRLMHFLYIQGRQVL
jgi:hypothetical protein